MSSGYPTIFIRLKGCNLRCDYCDTKYSYDEGSRMSIDDVLKTVKKHSIKRICITGGEPLLQKEKVLILLDSLKEHKINIETNGTIDLGDMTLSKNHRITMDLKTPSSGQEKHNRIINLKYLRNQDELKIVIGSREDYLWAKAIIKKHYSKGMISMSPVYGNIDPRDIIKWILDDELDIKFQIQIHKYIWDINERGV